MIFKYQMIFKNVTLQTVQSGLFIREVEREAVGRLLQLTNNNGLNSEVVGYPQKQIREMRVMELTEHMIH